MLLLLKWRERKQVMPRAKRNRTGRLQVRRYIWRPLAEGSRTEYKDGSKWKPCKNLNDARDIAEHRGYVGIQIEPM